MSLELESVEKQVGSFSADILARDAITKQWVLIENQIAPTDHSHLGQLLTYAAGLDARTVIWIAESFRDEHRAAIDFLNRATTDDFAFFAIQIELWKIGTSSFAPKFSLVAKPNEWSKQGQAIKQAADGELSQNQLMYREFWAAMIERAKTSFPALSVRQPYKSNWQVGEKLKGGDPSLDCNAAFTWDKGLRCEIWIDGALAKAAFNALRERSDDIEAKFGQSLIWEEFPEGKGSRIACYKPGLDKCTDRTKWNSYQEWLITWWPRMAETFRPFIKEIDFSQFSIAPE